MICIKSIWKITDRPAGLIFYPKLNLSLPAEGRAFKCDPVGVKLILAKVYPFLYPENEELGSFLYPEIGIGKSTW